MQVHPGDRQPSAPPPRPSVAISAISAEPPARPQVIDVSYWLWVAACLAGLITAGVTLRYFSELRGVVLAIVEHQYPLETSATREKAAVTTVATLIGAGALIAVVQLVLAVTMRSGRGWARFMLIGLTILGALYSVAVFSAAPTISQVGMLAGTALMVIAWVPMFLPGTRAWFAHRRAVRSIGYQN
jgi:hypothetical protein